MSYLGRSSSRRSFGSYFVEFILVALAVVISLFIYDNRTSQSDRDLEREEWHRIEQVLAHDQERILERAKSLDQSMTSLKNYLDADRRAFSIDSLENLVIPCLQYSVWSPPKMQVVIGHHTPLPNSIGSSPLMQEITILYTETFEELKLAFTLDRVTSTQRIIPYAEKHFSFLQNGKTPRRSAFYYGEFDAMLSTSFSIKSSTAESLRESARKLESIREQIRELLSAEAQED